jgi:apolipoprotein N-acyltransferase
MNRTGLIDVGLAVLSGLMLTVSFAPVNLDWIAWISLIPLLLSLRGKSSKGAFWLGFIAGLSHYLTLIYWMIVVLSSYGNLHPILSLGALILLCLYLALYSALFALIWNSFKEDRLSSFWGAVVWVVLEYARCYAMTGFPWCLLGYTQYLRLPVIQVSDIAGVYGISFVIVLVNLVLYNTVFGARTRKKKPARLEIILTSFLIGLILVYGFHRVKVKTEMSLHGKGIRLVIVQGNIDQSVKWNPEFQEKTVALYTNLSVDSRGFEPHLIIWPETAVPFYFQDNSPLSKEVLSVPAQTGSKLLFGSPAYVRDKNGIQYRNRAYMISEDRVFDYYDKVHLVPFGEYVPLKRYLPFVHRLVPAAGDFSPGRNLKPIGTSDLQTGVIICFEAIFPDISRNHAAHGAQLLVNLTNDAWFGRTSAPYQHLSMAVLRCVENGLPMARAANSGISAVILATGEIISKSELFTREVLHKELNLNGNKTFYSQCGDIFAILLLIIVILKFTWRLGKKRR